MNFTFPIIKINDIEYEPIFIIRDITNTIIRTITDFDIKYPIISNEITIYSIYEIKIKDYLFPLPCNNIIIYLDKKYDIPINKIIW